MKDFCLLLDDFPFFFAAQSSSLFNDSIGRRAIQRVTKRFGSDSNLTCCYFYPSPTPSRFSHFLRIQLRSALFKKKK